MKAVDFSAPLSATDRSSREQINKEMSDLNQTLHCTDQTGIHRTFHPTAAEHMVFSIAQGTPSRLDRMREHKMSLNKFKTEIVPSIFQPGWYATRHQQEES